VMSPTARCAGAAAVESRSTRPTTSLWVRCSALQSETACAGPLLRALKRCGGILACGGRI
jgi:hypothetical protein